MFAVDGKNGKFKSLGDCIRKGNFRFTIRADCDIEMDSGFQDCRKELKKAQVTLQ